MDNYSQYSIRYDDLLVGETLNVFNKEFAGCPLKDINYYNVYLTIYLSWPYIGRQYTLVFLSLIIF